MITILCSGSRGDFQPYIALALELKKAGVPVRIAAGKSFQDFVSHYGLDIYPISTDYKTVNLDPQFLKKAQSADNPLKMLLSFNKMKKYVVDIADEMYDACAGSDLIVYHPGCAIGYFAAAHMGIPSVLASPFPMHRTKTIASVIAYGHQKMPNALSYVLLQGLLWIAVKSSASIVLKKRLGKLPENFRCPYEKVDKQHPALVSCSNYVFPRPQDWSVNIHQHGYWFVDEPVEFTPSAELACFLSAGEKPIYFGFGSAFQEDETDRFIQLISEALALTNKRGIVSGMGDVANLPHNMLAVGSISHSWLFEHVSAVCHHGGAGTTAAGFKAGVPCIIIPFSNDQFAWAHRAFDLGVGTKPLNRKKLTAQDLAGAIEVALSDQVMSNSRELSAAISAENGARDCANVIEQLITKK